MRWIYFVLFTTAMLLLPAGAKRLTHGFRTAKMRIDYPFNPNWETANQPAPSVLNQRFHYLGKGAQCYVFESQDKQYVIKLFRYDQPNSAKKVERLFNACKLAYDEMREETGLVYIHLNPTELGLPTLLAIDAVGRRYRFNLDKMRFAVQKKADVIRDALERSKQNPSEMRQRIDAFFALLQKRIDKKIVNNDSNMTRNFGFLGEEAVEIDFGSYHRNVDLDSRQELGRFSNALRHWLAKHAPEWVDYCDEKSNSMVL